MFFRISQMLTRSAVLDSMQILSVSVVGKTNRHEWPKRVHDVSKQRVIDDSQSFRVVYFTQQYSGNGAAYLVKRSTFVALC